ncbi:lipase secretion chaperone [Hahella ganghwensis]|uniref:lipase secretion chaperone n=1 Tax=Hahella ganghwensis TaxID=286420 RepID=UPI000364475A|nr:lipase secretion chaperone [Hahella ganghwensis]
MSTQITEPPRISSLFLPVTSLLIFTACWLWQDRPNVADAAAKVGTGVAEQSLTDKAAEPAKADTSVIISETSDAAEEDEEENFDDFPGVTPKQYDGEAFASSLAGTDIDGELRVDESGHLVVSIDVKDFFDYFFNTVGEVAPEQALAESERLARTSLPPLAANEAMILMDQYLEYKQRALDLMQKPLIPADQQTPEYHLKMLGESLTELKQIRRDVMKDETVEAFFGKEEAYADFTLARLTIERDPNLSMAQKQQLIAEKRYQLPEDLRTVDDELAFSAARAQHAMALLQKATSQEEVRKGLKELEYEPEEVEEITDRWEERRIFNFRYGQYQVKRDEVLAAGLSEEDQEAQVESLRTFFFAEEEDRMKARMRDRMMM